MAEVLKAFVTLFLNELKKKRYNAEFYAAMVWVFEPNSSLHKYHYQISDEELKKIRTSHQHWRKEIKQDDKLDVCIRADEKSSITGWAQATVKEVKEDELTLEFDLTTPDYDGVINRWSTYIAKFESKTKNDHEWRKNILSNCKDVEIDAHD